MATSQRPSADIQHFCEIRGYSSLVPDGGFPYLLDRWSATVASVEAGYDSSFDEYLNDVDSRKIIDELATYATDAEWQHVEAILPRLDRRFIAATRSVLSCVWGDRNAAQHGYAAERDWWYYRLPVDVTRVADPGRWK